ncbi:MAG: response regulator [Chloroflexi bacterium]|nr:MAG: response regulator [Chloroflexota bacterium]
MTEKSSKKIHRISPEAANKDKDTIRVLYVEDAAVIRDTIARLLALSGFEVAYARNGEEGVKMTLEWMPDVVLMDLRMPVMDGFRAINQIKANPKTKDIPVFVVSAWSSKKERTQARLEGADEFFVKPPDLYQLIDAIQKAVAARKGK